MPPIRTDAIRAHAMRDVANELGTAAGNNTLISKDEEKTLVGLSKEGSQTARSEATDGRSRVPQATDAAGRILDRTIDQFNQPNGSGKAFLSRDEINNIRAHNPDVGGRLERAYNAINVRGAVLTGAPTTGAEYKTQLTPLVQRLQFGLLSSDGESPVEAYHLAGRTFTNLDTATFEREIAKIETKPVLAGGNVREAPLQALVDYHADPAVWGAGVKGDAEKAIALLRNLRDLQCFITNDPADRSVKPVYIVGLAPDNTIAGLKTATIWS